MTTGGCAGMHTDHRGHDPAGLRVDAAVTNDGLVRFALQAIGEDGSGRRIGEDGSDRRVAG